MFILKQSDTNRNTACSNIQRKEYGKGEYHMYICILEVFGFDEEMGSQYDQRMLLWSNSRTPDQETLNISQNKFPRL